MVAQIMHKCKNKAAVDTDFINHLAECKIGIDRVIQCLTLILEELGLEAIVHPLLCENEILVVEKKEIKKLFLSGVIRKIEFTDIFNEDEEKVVYYKYLVAELYNSMNSEPVPFSDEEILTCWKADKSLGEVHTLSMCLTINCGVFLSDDKDSKQLRDYINSNLGGNIVVYDRRELVNKHTQEGSSVLIRAERKSLTHT